MSGGADDGAAELLRFAPGRVVARLEPTKHVLDVLRERAAPGETVRGRFRERAGHEVVHLGWDARHALGWWWWVFVDQPRQDPGDVRGFEGALRREQVVGDRPQREEIGAAVELLAQRLLGRHVEWRAEELAGRGELQARGLDLRDPEIHDLRLAGVEQDDVAGLDVPVDDTARVRVVERFGDAGRDAQRLAPGQRPPGAHHFAQRPPLEELHRDVDGSGVRILADVVDDDDSGVGEPRRAARLLDEPRPEGFSIFVAHGEAEDDRLERHDAAQQRILGAIDDAHHPAPEFGLDLVARDLLRQEISSRRAGHRCPRSRR